MHLDKVNVFLNKRQMILIKKSWPDRIKTASGNVLCSILEGIWQVTINKKSRLFDVKFLYQLHKHRQLVHSCLSILQNWYSKHDSVQALIFY